MFGLGGKSYKVDEIDPRTRCDTLSNALGRRCFFVEPWPWGIGSPVDLSMLVRALSPDAVVCEKLPDLKLFKMDFLTLPVLFSGGGVGDGEVPVVDA